MKRAKPLVCLALSCCLASCGPGRSAPVAPPGAKSSPIAVSRVVSRIPIRSERYEGDPAEARVTYYWPGGRDRRFTSLLLEALRKQGYTVTADTLARGSDDHAPPARFELRGKVTDLSEDTQGAGTSQRWYAGIEVSWDLYDASRDKVVFSKSYRGAVVKIGSGNPFEPAFLQSVEQLLSDRGFATRLAAPADERSDGTGGSRWRQRPPAAPG